MPLITFIQQNQERIIREFAHFARTLMPLGAEMSEQELRDHAEEMLSAIAVDMKLDQCGDEQSRKSRGRGAARSMAVSGQRHADDRIQHGFSFEAVLAEFRALRATVLQLYEASGETDLLQLRRFNEAVDEALTESMKRYAQQTNLFRDQFVGIVSHDLRTPLGAISMGATLLEHSQDDQARQLTADRIKRSVRRMERMIADLLDLTQVRLGGSIPLKRQPTDFQAVCEDAVAEMRASRPAAALVLETAGNLRGHWDGDRLCQMVSNLLANAIEHGDGTQVTLTAEDAGESVTAAVHNGGAPIAPHARPSLFEPLTRGDRQTSDTPGIGLGLFIARAIIRAHGGEIHVASSEADGTTFIVTLPKGSAQRA